MEKELNKSKGKKLKKENNKKNSENVTKRRATLFFIFNTLMSIYYFIAIYLHIIYWESVPNINIGIIGKILGEYSFLFWGYFSLLIPISLLILGFLLYFKKKKRHLLSFLLFSLALSILITLNINDIVVKNKISGILVNNILLDKILFSYFGKIGAYIFSLFFIFFFLILYFHDFVLFFSKGLFQFIKFAFLTFVKSISSIVYNIKNKNIENEENIDENYEDEDYEEDYDGENNNNENNYDEDKENDKDYFQQNKKDINKKENGQKYYINKEEQNQSKIELIKYNDENKSDQNEKINSNKIDKKIILEKFENNNLIENEKSKFDNKTNDKNKTEILKRENVILSDEMIEELNIIERDTNLVIEEKKEKYKFPDIKFLKVRAKDNDLPTKEELIEKSKILQSKFEEFKIKLSRIGESVGPIITRYEFKLDPGIKISKVISLTDDISMAMKTPSVRIVAPIAGKDAIGIEIPNSKFNVINLRDIIETEDFLTVNKEKIKLALGASIDGKPVITDLRKMPHLLIAGTTGSGKSVCINSIILSILYQFSPEEIRLILIDPKRVELSIYNGLPHLASDVIVNVEDASGVLHAMVGEMERRYEVLASINVRNITDYNEKIEKESLLPIEERKINLKNYPKMPYYVIIIDELADLMMTAPKDIELSIARLAQMARAVGIHLILATQRPSVNVITGLIKANFPSRISFKVASKIDSRTVMDINGAEKLLGMGDMLFNSPMSNDMIRIHGAYVTTEEIETIINFIKENSFYEEGELEKIEWSANTSLGLGLNNDDENSELGDNLENVNYKQEQNSSDDLFEEAAKIVVLAQQASVSLLQRKLGIGYARAGKLIDELEKAGIVGPYKGSKARDVLITPEDFERNFFNKFK